MPPARSAGATIRDYCWSCDSVQQPSEYPEYARKLFQRPTQAEREEI